MHDITSLRSAEIESNAAFVSRGQQPVVVDGKCTFQLAVSVAGKCFDLDDIGTVVGKNGRGAGPGEIRSSIDDADAFQ